MFNNSFSVLHKDKPGEQRKANHAKHGRHVAEAEPTSNFFCINVTIMIRATSKVVWKNFIFKQSFTHNCSRAPSEMYCF